MINTKKDRENLYLRLSKLNLSKKLDKLLRRGNYYAREEDGKFVPNTPIMAHDTPWAYVKVTPDLRCGLFHRIFFDVLNFVPARCRECYKVVVRPRTLVELFDLYDFQCAMGVPCKCGIELRKTTTNLYGGYFYCRGLEEGKERYEEVRELVDEHLSPETDVILKRYCTEYEVGPGSKGPSDQLPEMTDEEKWFEEYVTNHFPVSGYWSTQPDHILANVMVDWIHHASRYNDPTYKEFTSGSPLFKPYVTYHQPEGIIEDKIMNSVNGLLADTERITTAVNQLTKLLEKEK